MQALVRSYSSKALVHNGHEQLGEGRGDRYAAVAVHIFGAPRAFVYWGDLGVSPVLGGQLGDGTVVQKMDQGVVGLRCHMFQQLQGQVAMARAFVRIKVVSDGQREFFRGDPVGRLRLQGFIGDIHGLGVMEE